MDKILLLIVSLVSSTYAEADTRILVRGSLVAHNNTNSFQQNGISHQRFENQNLALSQAIIAYSTMLTNNWQLHGVANAYSDGDQKIGISQLYAQYRPLTSSTIKPEIKIGFFYPSISAENTDFGWMSKPFLSNSAINSWIGEELRTVGIEASVRQNGRQVNRSWSWKLTGSIYKGNDSTGTLLSWRGFALHDRQSLHDDRIHFLPIPGVVSDSGINAPAWTEPFREIDTRLGYYVGAHLAHQRKSELRYYYYNNRANPLAVASDRIYAWRTRFHSLTLRHKVNSHVSIFGQALAGDTLMGEHIVENDFYATYAGVTYKNKSHQFSARIDWYQVVDNDNFMYDENDSQGEALTLNYTYTVSDTVSLSGEWQTNRGRQQNLIYFTNGNNYHENTLQLALTYRLE